LRLGVVVTIVSIQYVDIIKVHIRIPGSYFLTDGGEILYQKFDSRL